MRVRLGSRQIQAITIVVICFCVLVARPVAAQPPPTVNLRLPSDATGGGELAVRLTIPPQVVGPRYPDGFPILVFVPGGQGAGGLSGGQSFALEGFVAVTFLFPGGSDGGFRSDGTYDYRGPNCILALRDVLLFAGGRKADDLGRTIHDLLPRPGLTEMIGVNGSSNGGPISVACLATYGPELPFVATYVGWENPTGGQTVLVEVGGKSYDCDTAGDGDGNGLPADDGKNPYITSFGSSTIAMEWDRLSYDADFSWTVVDPANQNPPVLHEGALFLDGNGNGALDTVPGDPDCFDIDGDGVIDRGDDYWFRPTATYESGSMVLVYSIEVTDHAAAQGVFTPAWPGEVADTAACDTFWSFRDATRFYETLSTVRPDLRCLLAFGEADHVQAADAHPHIQQAYDGLLAGGLWCRLNPDEAYYRILDPNPPVAPADNDACIPVAWPDLPFHDEESPLSSTVASLAGVMEMADRAHAGVWTANLSGPIAAASDAPSVGIADLRIDPNPASMRGLVRWRLPSGGAATIHLFDVAGRSRGVFALSAGLPEGATKLANLTSPGTRPETGVYWIELRMDSIRVAQRLLLIGP